MRPVLLNHVDYGAATRGVPVAEAALHRAVLNLGRELVRRPRSAEGTLVLVNELGLSYARADVVAAVVDLELWRRRKRQGILPCTAPQPLSLALRMRDLKHPISAERLLGGLEGSERDRLRRALAELVRRRWVRHTTAGYRLSTVTRPAVKTLAAVEAKVDSWRRAVRQAQGLEASVDAAWLAFPASYVAKVPRQRPGLQRLGIISVEMGEARVVRRPSGRTASAGARALSEEHLYARWLQERANHPS